MKIKTKRKIKRILILLILGIIIGLGFMIYNILGPFRSFFWNAPYLAGFFGEQQYLILIQNNNELRPTGGFITAVADVSTFLGKPTIDVFDSYMVPDPKPRRNASEPFEYFIGQNDPFFAGWSLRDANFSPDFAKSAEDIISLYTQAYPEKNIKHVIAIDFKVIETLLDLYGPIDADGTSFTAENFFLSSQRISKDIDTHDVNQLKNRKNILKPFGQKLMSVITHSPAKYGTLMNKLDQLAKEKHVIAYSRAESLQKKLQDHGLTQTLEHSSAEKDYLHVNIANIGGRKADRYVTKDIKYRVDFSEIGKAQSTLEITLEHLGSYNIQSDIYQAYIRVYTPSGTKLSTSSGGKLRSTEISTDGNLEVFSDYIRLKPDEMITLSYSYLLPESIIPEDYQLQINKQPGIQNQFWQVAVRQQNESSLQNIRLKENTTALTIRENLAIWRGELDTDKYFHLMKTADTDGSIILWQKFIDLNTINVRFQEEIDPLSASNINNYQILDTDETNEKTDIGDVKEARFSKRDLWITVSGISTQPEEKYQLILRDIRDLHGNIISPNPMSRTLVQRIE